MGVGLRPGDYIAWRLDMSGKPLYVETVHSRAVPASRYNYSPDIREAATITPDECYAFSRLMRQCKTVGFWSRRP